MLSRLLDEKLAAVLESQSPSARRELKRASRSLPKTANLLLLTASNNGRRPTTLKATTAATANAKLPARHHTLSLTPTTRMLLSDDAKSAGDADDEDGDTDDIQDDVIRSATVAKELDELDICKRCNGWNKRLLLLHSFP